MATQNFNFKVKNGIDAGNTITAPAFVGDGSGLTNINVLNISSGVLPIINGGTGVTTSTGTGSLVFANSPTLISPILGSASATTLNKVTITAPSTSAVMTLANGSTFITSGAFNTTLTSTATTNVTLPVSGTLATVAGVETLTNKTISWSSNTFSGTVSTIGSTAIPAQSTVSSLSGLTNVSSSTFTSTIATGTAPFTVTSSTKVTNLNADLLDGFDHSDLGKVASDLTQFATTTATGFRGKINGTTGTSNLVFSDSPTFTGTPSAPTASIGTNTTQVATTAFVNNSLSTYNPANDQGSLLAAALASKANVDSPTFTGVPIFPSISNGKTGGSLNIPNSSYEPTSANSGDMWAKSGIIKWYDGTNTNSLAFLTSNVASASKLQTARTITSTGDVSWTGTFDGSSNISSTATLADTGVSAGSYGSTTNIPSFTVDSKGRLTNVSNNSVTFGNATLTLSKGTAGATNTDITIGTGTGFSANSTSNATYDVKVGPALTALSAFMTGAGSGFIKKNGQDAYAIDNSTFAGSSSAGGAANSVASSQVIKFDTGTTEGTDLYTFNGSSAKTIDIKAGSNITLSKTSGSITINTASSISSNAATATKLAGTKNINGVAFDGSVDITIPVYTSQKSDNVSYNIPFVNLVSAGNQSLYTDNEAVLTYNPSTNALTAGTFIGSLQRSSIIQINGGSTEGTNKYTFNNSSDKTLNINGGTGISLTTTAGALTIAANSVPWSVVTSTPTTLSGYGITDATPSSHIGTSGTSHAAATTSTAGFMSSADKTKLDGIATGANNYSLPATSQSTYGGVKAYVSGNTLYINW